MARGYLADVEFFSALNAGGDAEAARTAARNARALAPHQWVYASEEGNALLALDANGVPGPNPDWEAARAAYRDAVRLGSANPATFRYLAIVDHRLKLQTEAVQAAQRAVQLDRFDPATRATLAYVLTTPP